MGDHNNWNRLTEHAPVHPQSTMVDTVIVDTSEKSGGIAAAETVRLFKVQRGQVVWGIRTELIVEEGATSTILLGDSSDPNGYDNNVDLDATAGDVVKTLEASDAYAVGREYRADDEIIATHNNVTSVAKYKCTMIYSQMEYPKAAADPDTIYRQ